MMSPSADASIEWADGHCHLPDDVGEATTIVDSARAAGVTMLVDVGCDVASTRTAIEHAQRFDEVVATAGVHPHEAQHGIEGLAELASRPEVAAVGECGLDYYYDHSPRDVQLEVFAAQIRLAHDLAKPLVIHTRDAWDDTFRMLDTEGVPERTVFHCFTGGPDEAAEALGRGALLSFSGIVTFKSAEDLQAAAASCPLTRLMIETDSPYLAPVPFRGKPNQPALVTLVGEKIAALHEVPVHAVAATTLATTRAFFDRRSGG